MTKSGVFSSLFSQLQFKNFNYHSSVGFRSSLLLLFVCLSFSVSAQSVWSQVGSDIEGTAAEGLGATVSLSSDGSIMAIGAPNADAGGATGAFRGLVKVYALEGGAWVQKGSTINGTEDGAALGAGLSLSDDGTLLAIGAPNSASTFGEYSNSGQMMLYSWDELSGEWSLEETVDASAAGDNFGDAISLSGDGTVLAVGAPSHAAGGDARGMVRVFNWNGTTLSSREDLTGVLDFEGFGTAVSLSMDGSVLAVGSPSKDADVLAGVGQVNTYSWGGSAYSNIGVLDGVEEYDSFGDVVSLSDDGTRLAVSVAKVFGGLSYVELYDYSTSWSSIGTITSSLDSDAFGSSLSLSGDGAMVAIGADGYVTGNENGQAEVYQYLSSAWEQVDVTLTGEGDGDSFGAAVGISADGTYLAVGGPINGGGGLDAGHVRVFELAVPDLTSPTFTSASAVEYNENGTAVVYTATADEPVTFSLGSAKDEDLFSIVDAAISFVSTPDFETPGDGDANNIYELDVIAEDTEGNSTTLALTITVTDLDDTAPTFTSASTVEYAENGTAVAYTATADEPVTFSLGSAKDEALFSIVNAEISFVTSPDFETPGDTNNEYLLDVIATDGAGNSTTLTVTITVTDVDEVAPTFTSVAAVEYVENGAGVAYTATADETATFSLGSSKDESLFGISGAEISFTSTPDFEIPTDGNVDNAYQLDVIATDAAGNSTTLAVTITVTDVDEIAPTVAVESDAFVTSTADFAVAVQFSEEVFGLELADFVVTGATKVSLADFPILGDYAYGVTLTPDGTGNITFQLPADMAQDAAGNGNVASELLTITFDATAPVVSMEDLYTTDPTPALTGSVDDPTAVVTVTVDGQSLTATNNGDGTWSVADDVIIELAEATYEVTVSALDSYDNVSEDYLATLKVDYSAPSVFFYNGSYNENITYDIPVGYHPFIVHLGFYDEQGTDVMLDFTIEDIEIVGEIGVTGMSPAESDSYFLAINLLDDTYSQQVTVNIPAGVATDRAGNANLAGTVTITLDVDAPVVSSINTVGSNITNASSIPVEVTFNEKVTGLTAAGFTVTNGTITEEPTTTDSLVYALTVQPTAEGQVTVKVDADAVEDLAGNLNLASDVLDITYDLTAPTVTITGEQEITNENPVVSVQFSEASILEAGDLTITNGEVASVTTQDNITFSVEITPSNPVGGSTEGIDVTVALEAGKATDLAGNTSGAAEAVTISYDGFAPEAILYDEEGVALTMINGTVKAILLFSEEVPTDLLESNIVVTNGSKANFEKLPFGDTFYYQMDLMPNDGTEGLTVTIPAGSFADNVGNPNAEAVFNIGVDTQAPTVSIASTVTGPTNQVSIPVTFAFGEEVKGFTAESIATGNLTVSNFNYTDNNTYTADIAPTANGQLSVSLKAGLVTDLAGNAVVSTGDFTIVFDNVAPTLEIVAPATVNSTEAFTLTFNFSEAVAFTADQFTLENAAKGTVTSTSTSSYTTQVTPTGAGDISIAVNAFADEAGNTNATSVSASTVYDATRPTVSIKGVPTLLEDKNAFNITISFSEVVTGFAIGDIEVGLGSASNLLSSNNKDFTADITPDPEIALNELVTIDIAAGVAVDAANNGNTAADQASVKYFFKYSGGSGTEADPYLIANNDDLRLLTVSEGDWGGHFKQIADIVFDEEKHPGGYQPIGSSEESPFTGSYDGGGYSIEGLTISSSDEAIAMFREVKSDYSIENLNLLNVSIENSSDSYTSALVANVRSSNLTISEVKVSGKILGGVAGSILGIAWSGSVNMSNCINQASISASPTKAAGGLVAVVYSADLKITSSANYGNVTSTGSGGLVSSVLGSIEILSSFNTGSVVSHDDNGVYGNNAGGILATGIGSKHKFVNCYNVGHVKSEGKGYNSQNSGGGIVGGCNSAELTNCYSIGMQESEDAIGGLIGGFTGQVKGQFESSYFDSDLSAVESSAEGGIGHTTEEMRKKETYSNWDFTNIWHHAPGFHPILKWQLDKLEKFEVTGKVLDKDGNPFTQGTVKAKSLGFALNSATIASDGTFKLEGINPWMHSIMVESANSDYINTYYGDANRDNLSRHVINSRYDIEINMIEKAQETALGGKGIVSGRVVRSAAGARIQQGRILEGEALAGVTVFLVRTSDGETLTSAITDENGDFEITGIPAGDYQLLLDVSGVELNLEGSSFSVDEEGTPLNISAAIGDEGISFAIEEVLATAGSIDISVYPNPATDYIQLQLSGSAYVRVLDMSGRAIQATHFTEALSIDMRSMQAGIYILDIKNDKGQSTIYRVIKN